MTIGPLTLSPPQKLQFFIPGTTTPAAGAKLFTYAAGTTTKQATYSNINQTPNTNPIILDANGECICFLDSTLEYDVWFSPSTDTDPPTNPYWTVGSVGYADMINGFAPLNSPEFTGEPTAPTPTSGDNSTNIATTQFVQNAITQSFVNPTATTPSAGDYSNKIATTAFVGQAINTAWQLVVFGSSGTWTIPTNVTWAKFRIWGGGGGGGGASSGSSGSGGGGAGYAEGTISLGTNTSLSIVIGSGGSGGGVGNAGTAGTASTIAALSISAGGGGAGGGNSGSPGSGGTSSGLTIALTGSAGEIGQFQSGPNVYQGGQGGSAVLGGSGGSGAIAGSNPGGSPGGGGSGGGPLIPGGNGAGGLCIIEWMNP